MTKGRFVLKNSKKNKKISKKDLKI